eukprot:380552_1
MEEEAPSNEAYEEICKLLLEYNQKWNITIILGKHELITEDQERYIETVCKYFKKETKLDNVLLQFAFHLEKCRPKVINLLTKCVMKDIQGMWFWKIKFSKEEKKK